MSNARAKYEARREAIRADIAREDAEIARHEEMAGGELRAAEAPRAVGESAMEIQGRQDANRVGVKALRAAGGYVPATPNATLYPDLAVAVADEAIVDAKLAAAAAAAGPAANAAPDEIPEIRKLNRDRVRAGEAPLSIADALAVVRAARA